MITAEAVAGTISHKAKSARPGCRFRGMEVSSSENPYTTQLPIEVESTGLRLATIGLD